MKDHDAKPENKPENNLKIKPESAETSLLSAQLSAHPDYR